MKRTIIIAAAAVALLAACVSSEGTASTSAPRRAGLTLRGPSDNDEEAPAHAEA